MGKPAAIEGCLTAIVTPFKDGKVDFDGLAKLVDWQIEQGVDGIVAVGTTGESATLDVDEHVAVIAADGQGREAAACRWSPAPAATPRARRSS